MLARKFDVLASYTCIHMQWGLGHLLYIHDHIQTLAQGLLTQSAGYGVKLPDSSFYCSSSTFCYRTQDIKGC